MQDAVQVMHDGCQQTIIAWLLPFWTREIILYKIISIFGDLSSLPDPEYGL